MKFIFLVDLNFELMIFFLKCLNIKTKIVNEDNKEKVKKFTSSFKEKLKKFKKSSSHNEFIKK